MIAPERLQKHSEYSRLFMTFREQGRVRSRRNVLKTGLGIAVGGGTIGLVSQRAAAHFPDELAIDIRPGSDRNRIAGGCRGLVPVAVLPTTIETDGSSTAFDPTERAVRYRFGAPDTVENGGGTRPVHDGHVFEASEGCDALMLHFRVDGTGFDRDTSVGKLVWERSENSEHGYAGTDRVTVVGDR